MGLFSFIKNIGADLFKGGDEAEEVQEMLQKEFGDRISDLNVEFDDGAVTLAGKCDTCATREKAVLLAGNVKGIEKVNDENFTAPKKKPNFMLSKRAIAFQKSPSSITAIQ
jgi:hypothetical protein